MKKLVWIAATIAILSNPSGVRTQILQSGDLAAHLDSLIDDMPATYDGGDYLQPNTTSRSLWQEIIAHILGGEYGDAHAKALTRNHQVVLFTDGTNPDSNLHVILERTSSSSNRYWGTFVFNATPLRPHLVIQSPHPRFDSNTGYQSIRIYLHSVAHALFLSGTHRCNGLTDSPCSGSTSICGGSSQPYRYSDQAHVVLSTFQITTETMLGHDPELVVIQPHGFAQGEDDPDLILSNGTRTNPSGTDYAVAISNAIQAIEPSLTTRIGHIDLSWTRLLGTTNTQGRLINGSADPCGTPATSATGQFVHVEQARMGLRDTPQNWMKLAQAVVDAIPVETTAVPKSIVPPDFRIRGNYPNPFPMQTHIEFELGRSAWIELEVFNVAGCRIATLARGTYPAGAHRVVWSADDEPPGVYFVRLLLGGESTQRSCVVLR